MICLDCGAEFTEMEQTRGEYRDGQCPECKGEDINEEETPTEVIDLDTLPYYAFKRTEGKRYLEGRFWNQGGKQLAIVAIVTHIGDFGDWAAYIGTDAPNSLHTEEDTCIYVAEYGCKLSERDARHFFPGVKLPYRP